MTKKHTVILQPSGRRGQVDEGTSIRAAARELGVEIDLVLGQLRVPLPPGHPLVGVTADTLAMEQPSEEQSEAESDEPHE